MTFSVLPDAMLQLPQSLKMTYDLSKQFCVLQINGQRWQRQFRVASHDRSRHSYMVCKVVLLKTLSFILFFPHGTQLLVQWVQLEPWQINTKISRGRREA